jgi:hypothetical protein
MLFLFLGHLHGISFDSAHAKPHCRETLQVSVLPSMVQKERIGEETQRWPILPPETNVSIAHPVLLLSPKFSDTWVFKFAYENSTFEGGIQAVHSMRQVFLFKCYQSSHKDRPFATKEA